MAQTQGANRRGLIVLLFFTFFMVMGFEMIMPLIIGQYVNNMNFSATAVAFVLAIRRFIQQGLAMVGGTLADRFDVRTLISIGVLLRSLGFFTLAFANNFSLLLISMVLAGFGGVLFETPYQTAIAILTTEENRSHYFSLNNTVIGIASTIGPLLGVSLLHLDFKAVCFGAALCFMINFIISRFTMPPVVRTQPSYSVKSSLKAVSKDRQFLIFTLLMVVFWLAASQINIGFPLRIQEISQDPDSVGVMWAVYAAITALLQYPLVTLMLRKYSPRQCVVMGIFIIASAFLFISFVSTTNMFLVAVVLFTIGMIMARPNQQTIAIAMADPKAMGMYLGANSVGFALGTGFGSIIGGILYDMGEKTNLNMLPWFLYSLLAILSMFGFMLFKNIGVAKTVIEETN